MKHKHSEIIKAWADGADVQYKDYTGKWVDVVCPTWHTDKEYRIKPQTLMYRVALFSFIRGEGKHPVAVSTVAQAETFERDAYFIRWLTDWVEVEV